MNRIGMLTLVLMMTMSLSAFAQGSVEEQMPESAETEDSTVELREIGVTGRLSIFGRQVVLEAEETRYLLQYHRHLAADIDVDSESEVTVYGYIMPGELPYENMKRMMISRAVIDGESFSLGITSPEGVLLLPADIAGSPHYGPHHSSRGFGRWGEAAPAEKALQDSPAFSYGWEHGSTAGMHHGGWRKFQEPADAGERYGSRSPLSDEVSGENLPYGRRAAEPQDMQNLHDQMHRSRGMRR